MAPRRGVPDSTTRSALIDAAERLIRTKGPAALTAGRLADELGLKRQSVHYYFGTIDDLIVAVLDRQAGKLRTEMDKSLEAGNPLRAAWGRHQSASVYTFEIMTLAMRRPLIREALQRHLVVFRNVLAQSIAAYFVRCGREPPLPPAAIATAFLGVAQALAADRAIGVEVGHVDLIAWIEQWMDTVPA